MLLLGPFAVPWALLILLAALQFGSWLAHKLAAIHQLELKQHVYWLCTAGLVAARLGFVLQYPQAYANDLLSVLDIRDSGWSASTGFAAATLYTLSFWLRAQYRVGQALMLGVATTALIWWAGLAIVQQFSAPPSALPAWSTLNLQGDHVSFAALQGKPVVVNLWASWCPPCVREMPVLVQAQQAYPDVQFIWLNQQEAAATVARFASLHGIPAVQTWLDAQGFMPQHTGQNGLPTTLFYDAAGQLQAVRNGELSAASLQHYLQQIPR